MDVRDRAYSASFEQHLADKVAAYWAAHGYVVRTWLETEPDLQHGYPRSDLVNGLPQGEAVPGVEPTRLRGVRM